MDQSKLRVPKILTNTKALGGMLSLNNHLTGIIITSGYLKNDREHLVFVNSDQYAQDSNKTVTQIIHALSHFKGKVGHLPRKLLVQTDNCKKVICSNMIHIRSH